MILIKIVLIALYSLHKGADQLSAVRSSFLMQIFIVGFCVTAEMPFPNNFFLAFSYSFLVKGEQYFEPGPDDVEASELYPYINYTTVDEFLNRYM
jgi:hypothetical protein